MIATRALMPLRVVERNLFSYRRNWVVLVSGMFEPIFFLFGLGIGLGMLVGDLEWNGEMLTYAEFVAPGLVASSAMNGALFDMTFNFYYKLKESRTFDALLASPLSVRDILNGELSWAMVRGGIYSGSFVFVMLAFGLVASWWAALIPAAALLVGLAFASLGSFGTSFARNWQDLDVLFLITQPLFLLSTTFFTLDVYPGWLQPVVQATPLYHGVDLIRDLARGTVDESAIGHVVYLVVITIIARYFVAKRLHRLLLT